MWRRLIDGLVVLWGITACLLLVGGRNLFAAPGGCDKECREILVEGRPNSNNPLVTDCIAVKYKECQVCVLNGGCWMANKVLPGKCQTDYTTTQESDNSISCNILCPGPVSGTMYEAHTNDTPKYAPFSNPMTCK